MSTPARAEVGGQPTSTFSSLRSTSRHSIWHGWEFNIHSIGTARQTTLLVGSACVHVTSTWYAPSTGYRRAHRLRRSCKRSPASWPYTVEKVEFHDASG